MFSLVLSAIALLGASGAHAVTHVAIGDFERIVHFSDHRGAVAVAFLLAIVFMLWVLWGFWRDSHR